MPTHKKEGQSRSVLTPSREKKQEHASDQSPTTTAAVVCGGHHVRRATYLLRYTLKRLGTILSSDTLVAGGENTTLFASLRCNLCFLPDRVAAIVAYNCWAATSAMVLDHGFLTLHAPSSEPQGSRKIFYISSYEKTTKEFGGI